MVQESAAIAEAKPTSQFAEVNGLKLHYLDWGGDSGRTIVLCHGGSAHAQWWDYLAPLLRPFGRVIALDFRGHGRSQWASTYGPAAHISDLKSFLRDHIGSRVLLIGHSMGGEISQRVAFDCPEMLEAMVLVDSPHGGPPLKTRLMWRWKRRNQDGPRPEFANATDLVRKFRLSPPGHFLSTEALAELAMKGSEQLPNGNWAFRFDPKTRKPTGGWRRLLRFPLQRIRMPVLILRGEHSALLTAQTARWMHRRIHGSIYREIARAYHHVPLDNPVDTGHEIGEFIAKL